MPGRVQGLNSYRDKQLCSSVKFAGIYTLPRYEKADKLCYNNSRYISRSDRMDIIQLFEKIDEYFIAKRDHIQLFTESERQVEGWFKGELIYLFTSLQTKIKAWEPEVSVSGLGRKKIDFMVKLDDGVSYLEIKSLYHGKQKGQPINLGIYFYKDNIGIWGDVQKLASIDEGHGYCILFIYPRPEVTAWSDLLVRYNKKIINTTSLREVSDIARFPAELYIAKLMTQSSKI